VAAAAHLNEIRLGLFVLQVCLELSAFVVLPIFGLGLAHELLLLLKLHLLLAREYRLRKLVCVVCARLASLQVARMEVVSYGKFFCNGHRGR